MLNPKVEYLRNHPQICMADRKEVHFFDNEKVYKNTDAPDHSYYHSFFQPQPQHRIVGEATPIYMYWYEAPKRMWRYNPCMKLLVVLRNPVDRAYSHWHMERSRNAERLSFWDAIQNERVRCRETLPYQHRVYSYTDRGFYLEQLRRLWTFFPRDQMLVLRNKELRYYPEETLQKVCRFLGVDFFQSIENKTVHAGLYSSQMSEREREYLNNLYYYEIKGLEAELNWDCSDWLEI
jgi:hypothetical protein